jgi:hypothetical protein
MLNREEIEKGYQKKMNFYVLLNTNYYIFIHYFGRYHLFYQVESSLTTK